MAWVMVRNGGKKVYILTVQIDYRNFWWLITGTSSPPRTDRSAWVGWGVNSRNFQWLTETSDVHRNYQWNTITIGSSLLRPTSSGGREAQMNYRYFHCFTRTFDLHWNYRSETKISGSSLLRTTMGVALYYRYFWWGKPKLPVHSDR
jgi:hypothetical protein